MMSRLVAWDRLVRYRRHGNDEICFGQPILPPDKADETDQLAEDGKLEVEVLEGSSPFDARPSGRTERVGKLLGPLTPADVPIVRCIGLNYKTHSELNQMLTSSCSHNSIVLETGRALPTCPTIFTKPGPAIADHGEAIPVPKIAQSQCDYEGELVIVIGREGKDIAEADALDYVAGYTVGNDVSARDWQRDTDKAGPVPQWTFSKSFDKYAPLGPCLVAGHLLGDADSLRLRTLVNGEVRQESNTGDLCFGVRKLVAFCSQGQTLQKGSVLMTGTPGGVGLFMKPQAFLKHRDEVCVEITGIGRLSNRMVFEGQE